MLLGTWIYYKTYPYHHVSFKITKVPSLQKSSGQPTAFNFENSIRQMIQLTFQRDWPTCTYDTTVFPKLENSAKCFGNFTTFLLQFIISSGNVFSKFTFSQRLRSQAIWFVRSSSEKSGKSKNRWGCENDGLYIGVDKPRILTTLFVYGQNWPMNR